MNHAQAAKSEFSHWDSYWQFARHVRFSSRYVLGDEEQAFLRTVLATLSGRDAQLKEGMILYRAQRGVDLIDRTDDDGNWIGEDIVGYGPTRMKPLLDRAREGRANPTGIPVLYVGTTVITAISEVRPWVGTDVSVAMCKLRRPLRTTPATAPPGRS